MNDERVYPTMCYALELPSWLTWEQAAQQFGTLQGCARRMLSDLAAAGVIRRQWLYGWCYYQRDDVTLVAATIARHALVHDAQPPNQCAVGCCGAERGTDR